jgi:hypothetical protein
VVTLEIVPEDRELRLPTRICNDCAVQFGLSGSSLVDLDDPRFPYIAPVCAECLRRAQAAGDSEQ